MLSSLIINTSLSHHFLLFKWCGVFISLRPLQFRLQEIWLVLPWPPLLPPRLAPSPTDEPPDPHFWLQNLENDTWPNSHRHHFVLRSRDLVQQHQAHWIDSLTLPFSLIVKDLVISLIPFAPRRTTPQAPLIPLISHPNPKNQVILHHGFFSQDAASGVADQSRITVFTLADDTVMNCIRSKRNISQLWIKGDGRGLNPMNAQRETRKGIVSTNYCE